MKLLIVLSFDVPEPENVAQVIEAINPPSLPYFAGKARVVIDPHATEVEEWLDAD